MMPKTSSSNSVIPAKAGNLERKTGFRVKPGMTDPKVLRKWYAEWGYISSSELKEIRLFEAELRSFPTALKDRIFR